MWRTGRRRRRWTEHLPLLDRGQVKDQDVTADAEVSTEVSIYRWDKD